MKKGVSSEDLARINNYFNYYKYKVNKY